MASLLRLVASPLAAVWAGAFLFASAPGLAADCTVSRDRFLFEPTLPGLVERLSAGKPVTIVAIGGASTEGRAGGGPDYAWPSQLGVALKRDFPAAPITIVNLGKARQTAAATQARFAKEVFPRKPNLVVWETGTVDAVRNVDLDSFRETLQTGIAKLRPTAEVVLMDMQFSRLTHAMIDFEPYKSAMVQMADLDDVPLFPRNELMRDWSESGEIDYAVQDKNARQVVARKLYRCIGETLAVFLIRRPGDGAVRP
jgi:lysophospholipase L1-like esterase